MRSLVLALTILAASPALAQFDPFGGLLGPSVQQPKPERQHTPPKPAPKLSFDPKAKVRGFVELCNHPRSTWVITPGGRKVANRILAYGRPIDLDGCYYAGTIYWDANDELKQIAEADFERKFEQRQKPQQPRDILDFSVGGKPRDSWQPSPIKGIAIRVKYELSLDGKRYYRGETGGVPTGGTGSPDFVPLHDETFLIDFSGNIFGSYNSRAFATYDVREDMDMFGQIATDYDYRAPLQ